jgi:hypothetical protein
LGELHIQIEQLHQLGFGRAPGPLLRIRGQLVEELENAFDDCDTR